MKTAAALSILLFAGYSFAQRPGGFIYVLGFWEGLRISQIIVPPNVRTRLLYQVPNVLFPSYRQNLREQIFGARLLPLEYELLPTNQEIPEVEAFGIPNEVRNNPAKLLRLLPAAEALAGFGIDTSNPELSSYMLRPGMRNIAIIALGVMANIHIEAAGAMREQGFAQNFIDEQLERAHHLMGLQIQYLARALNDNQDVAAVLQEIIENRDTLGYVPPSPPPRTRFLGGFWTGGSH